MSGDFCERRRSFYLGLCESAQPAQDHKYPQRSANGRKLRNKPDQGRTGKEANIASRRDYGEAGTGCTAFNVPCSGKRIGNNRGQTCSSARKSHQRPTGIAEQQDEDKPCRGQKSPVTYEVAASKLPSEIVACQATSSHSAREHRISKSGQSWPGEN